VSVDISVIIPHLNQHAALARLLRSLDAQVAPGIAFEVIVADNGSATPLPGEVLAHPLVTIVYEPSPGPGPARNRGVSAARGGILAFIDADCAADESWLKTIFRYLQKPGGEAVIGGDVRIKPRGARLDPIEAYESIFGYRFELYIRRDGYAGTGNLAMRREVFDAVGPFGPIHIAEDRDWGQRATRAGFAPGYVSEMIIYTKARESFSELGRKWDRHMAHEFAGVRGLKGRLAWVLRSVALAVSPIAEIPRVVTSPRISGVRARVLAWGVLVRIRIHRFQRMLQLLLGRNPEEMALSWQKKK
jgi:glycosyltransferase involved in cell wall biosynthesis